MHLCLYWEEMRSAYYGPRASWGAAVGQRRVPLPVSTFVTVSDVIDMKRIHTQLTTPAYLGVLL